MCGHRKHHGSCCCECNCECCTCDGHHCDCDSECCCEEEHDHGSCCEGGAHHGAGRHFRRRFETRAERIAKLEAYLRDLQAEAQAVEEQIAELKGVG